MPGYNEGESDSDGNEYYDEEYGEGEYDGDEYDNYDGDYYDGEYDGDDDAGDADVRGALMEIERAPVVNVAAYAAEVIDLVSPHLYGDVYIPEIDDVIGSKDFAQDQRAPVVKDDWTRAEDKLLTYSEEMGNRGMPEVSSVGIWYTSHMAGFRYYRIDEVADYKENYLSGITAKFDYLLRFGFLEAMDPTLQRLLRVISIGCMRMLFACMIMYVECMDVVNVLEANLPAGSLELLKNRLKYMLDPKISNDPPPGPLQYPGGNIVAGPEDFSDRVIYNNTKELFPANIDVFGGRYADNAQNILRQLSTVLIFLQYRREEIERIYAVLNDLQFLN